MKLGRLIHRQSALNLIEETIKRQDFIKFRDPISEMRVRIIRKMPRTANRFKL